MLRYLILLVCVLCSAGAALASQPVIMVFGDSLSAGYGLAENTGWVALLQRELSRQHLRYSVNNASLSGETTSGGAARIVAALSAAKPEIVILELGGNDGMRGTPLAVVRANLEKMIQAIQKARAQTLLIGVELPPNYGKRYTEKFQALYQDLALRYRLASVPSLMRGFEQNREMFQADGIHPLAQAQPIMLQNVWLGLKPLLK
jgi:acyl-CoA thioesterase I